MRLFRSFVHAFGASLLLASPVLASTWNMAYTATTTGSLQFQSGDAGALLMAGDTLSFRATAQDGYAWNLGESDVIVTFQDVRAPDDFGSSGTFAIALYLDGLQVASTGNVGALYNVPTAVGAGFFATDVAYAGQFDQLFWTGLMTDMATPAFLDRSAAIHQSGWYGQQVSAVPLPAAVWLFGSALLGMFGLRRRAGSAAA